MILFWIQNDKILFTKRTIEWGLWFIVPHKPFGTYYTPLDIQFIFYNNTIYAFIIFFIVNISFIVDYSSVFVCMHFFFSLCMCHRNTTSVNPLCILVYFDEANAMYKHPWAILGFSVSNIISDVLNSLCPVHPDHFILHSFRSLFSLFLFLSLCLCLSVHLHVDRCEYSNCAKRDKCNRCIYHV